MVLYEKQIKEMESKIVTRSHEINKLFLDINQKNKEMKKIKESCQKIQVQVEEAEARLKHRKRLIRSSPKLIDDLRMKAIKFTASEKLKLQEEEKQHLGTQEAAGQLNLLAILSKANDATALLNPLAEQAEENSNSVDNPEQLAADPENMNLTLGSNAMSLESPAGQIDFFSFDQEYAEILRHLAGVKQTFKQHSQRFLSLKTKLSEDVKSQIDLEKQMTQSRREIKNIQKFQIEFYIDITKQGVDCRAEGLVWLLSKIRTLGGEIREDLLPEWLDEDSKQWLLKKLQVFERLRELEAMYKFYWDVFKGFIGVEERFDEPSHSQSADLLNLNQPRSSDQDAYSNFESAKV